MCRNENTEHNLHRTGCTWGVKWEHHFTDFIPAQMCLFPLFEMHRFELILAWLAFIWNAVVIKTKSAKMQQYVIIFWQKFKHYHCHSESFSGSPCHCWWSEVVVLCIRGEVRCTLHSKLLRALQPGPIPDSVVIKHPQRSFTISPQSSLHPGKCCQQPIAHLPSLIPHSCQSAVATAITNRTCSSSVSWVQLRARLMGGPRPGGRNGKGLEELGGKIWRAFRKKGEEKEAGRKTLTTQ